MPFSRTNVGPKTVDCVFTALMKDMSAKLNVCRVLMGGMGDEHMSVRKSSIILPTPQADQALVTIDDGADLENARAIEINSRRDIPLLREWVNCPTIDIYLGCGTARCSGKVVGTHILTDGKWSLVVTEAPIPGLRARSKPISPRSCLIVASRSVTLPFSDSSLEPAAAVS